MWARRCGAPPGWPSRVKVLLFSSFSGTIGLSVYNYMQAGSMSYLDFGAPTSVESLCLSEWPERSAATDISHPNDWLSTESEWEAQHRCPQATPSSCDDVAVPLHLLANPLAVAMGPGSRISLDEHGYSSYTMDQMVFWARCFLVITSFMWIGMTIHDLALAGGGAKDYVMDVIGINERFPLIRRTWRRTAGVSFYKHISHHGRSSIRGIGMSFMIVISPALFIWNLLVFHFIIVPIILCTFVLYPIRMSRAWVFVVAILSSLYGLALTIHFVFLTLNAAQRPRYAATWPVVIENGVTSVASSGGDCVCGCNYVISWGVCANVALIGGTTLFKSICIALRCLKGLRRTQWASLLSVLFPVPLTVYEVSWRRHDNRPIKFREEGQPVQGEYAFDPFAMMDEQEDSAYTTLDLRPTPIHFKDDECGQRICVGASSRVLAMPSMPKRSYSEEDIKGKEYIGCCGFPWRTSGKMVHWNTMEEALAAHKDLFDIPSLTEELDDLEIRSVDEGDLHSTGGGGGGGGGGSANELHISRRRVHAPSCAKPVAVTPLEMRSDRPSTAENACPGGYPVVGTAPLEARPTDGDCGDAGAKPGVATQSVDDCPVSTVEVTGRAIKEVDLDHATATDEEADDPVIPPTIESQPPKECRSGVPGLQLCC